MQIFKAAFKAITLCLLFPSMVFAWGADGHQATGIIAAKIIKGSRAEERVREILGLQNKKAFTLEYAAVWEDCIRSVNPKNHFNYISPVKESAVCNQLAKDPRLKDEMIAFVKDNHDNCEYAGKNFECHRSFHFTNVDFQREKYDSDYPGAKPYDIVNSINAAIRKLKGEPSLTVHRFATEKQALLVLVHLLGDLHQPLHVGSIYLDPQGAIVAADQPIDRTTDTVGGNSILRGQACKSQNLHALWDDTKYKSQRSLLAKTVAHQLPVPIYSADIYQLAEIWASETIEISGKSFSPLKFSPFDQDACHKWHLTEKLDNTYLTNMKDIQDQQIVKAGYRLAQILNAIWP